MEIFYAITVITVDTLLYKIVKTHPSVQLKWLKFTITTLYHNKTGENIGVLENNRVMPHSPQKVERISSPNKAVYFK